MNEELCNKSDYDLIKMYKANDRKKDVLEVLYFRYLNLIHKKSVKFCNVIGYSYKEDFKQEAFIELVKCLDSINLDRVDERWKIVSIYGLRLKNLGRTSIKNEIKNSDHMNIITGDLKYKKTRMIPYEFNKGSEEDGTYVSKSDYIENNVPDVSDSMRERYFYIRSLFSDFLDTVDKIEDNKRKHWLKEFLTLVHNGVHFTRACELVGVSRQSWYNTRGRVKEQFKIYEENHNIY